MHKKTALLVALISWGFVTIQCGGDGGPGSAEDLTTLLTSKTSFTILQDEQDSIYKEFLKFCHRDQTNGIMVDMIAPDIGHPKEIIVSFKADNTVKENADGETVANGDWKAVDENTIDVRQGGRVNRIDVQIDGDTLHMSLNEENQKPTCGGSLGVFDKNPTPAGSTPNPAGSVGPSTSTSTSTSTPTVPSTPTTNANSGPTAQALQGTWCLYQGYPYYFVLEGDPNGQFSAAYVYKNSSFVKGSVGQPTVDPIDVTVDETAQSASVKLIADPQVNLTGLNDPAQILFNGATKNYIKINYGSNKVGFFKRSDTAGTCPDVKVTASQLALLPGGNPF